MQVRTSILSSRTSICWSSLRWRSSRIRISSFIFSQTRTIKVERLSDLATERELHDFFSSCGEVEFVEILSNCEANPSRTAYVTFKHSKALEIAVLLSGANIVNELILISPVRNYVPRAEIQFFEKATPVEDVSPSAEVAEKQIKSGSLLSGNVYATKAHDVLENVFSKGSTIGQDAMKKARAFDVKHHLTASASAKVLSLDRRVGLTDKLTVGISVVNEKMKSVDQKLHVSNRTMTALFAAERKLNDTGSAVRTNRYVTAGTNWLNGAYTKMARVGQIASLKSRETVHLAVSNLTAEDPIAA